MYDNDFKHNILWVTTHLKEEKPVRHSPSFPRTWHCADTTNFNYEFIKNNNIYIGTWANPVLVTGRSICGMKWNGERAVTGGAFNKASSLCGNCVKKLLNVDSMSAEEVLGYFYDYMRECYDGEFGRWFHDDEEAIIDALENKVTECVKEVINS